MVEREIDSSDYVHEEMLISWLQSYDNLKAENKYVFNYEEVLEITGYLGVEDTNVPKMLSFLHGMGMLMWHEEEGLRDVVIMDPDIFFVQPVTNIICRHTPTAKDDTLHNTRLVHKRVEQILPSEYSRMKEGVASERLMQELLSECGSNYEIVLKLMIKCGLVSKIIESKYNVEGFSIGREPSSNSVFTIVGNKGGGGGVAVPPSSASRSARSRVSYLVPSLLQLSKPPISPFIIAASISSNKGRNTFYFYFFASNSIESIRNEKMLTWAKKT